MNELKIKGHSGCGLRIIEDTGCMFVEKSCNKSYTDRLHKQYLKQRNAVYMTQYTGFDVPHPVWTDESTILMPYIHAMSFIEYFERASKSDIDTLVTDLIKYICYEYQCSSVKSVSTKVFIDKVNSVNENTKNNPILSNYDISIVNDECKRALDYLYKLNSIDIPVGKCHGDLTFSNILFKSAGKHALIDFLDSFVETPLQDIVKIRQDTLYGWSLMMTTQQYNEAHIKTVLKYIDNKIMNEFTGKEMQYYNILQYINILRIVPYVKEHKVFERLIEILDSIKL